MIAKAFTLLLALVAAQSVCAECNGVYYGVVVQEWPKSQRYPFGENQFGGKLTAFWDDGEFTHFVVNSVEYDVQHPNVTAATFDNVHCSFGIRYNADPIFRGALE